MIKDKDIKNIPVEKIKIGDEEYKIKHYDMLKYKELEIQKFGLKRPFTVTKIGEDYVLYNCLNTFTAAKNAGLKEVPCKVIGNKMMNERIKELNYHKRGHEIKEI